MCLFVGSSVAALVDLTLRRLQRQMRVQSDWANSPICDDHCHTNRWHVPEPLIEGSFNTGAMPGIPEKFGFKAVKLTPIPKLLVTCGEFVFLRRLSIVQRKTCTD